MPNKRPPPVRQPSPTRREPGALEVVAAAIDGLADAGQLLRTRLDAIDPLEHAARWAGINDEIRALDDRIHRLREEQQRLALAGTELRPLATGELERLRQATATVAELVRTTGRIAAVAEAAVRLSDAAGAVIQRLQRI
ncbi:MAG TPA: hypothetical protein VGB85_16040 [Nannocystis sp.]|jgi:hypothetical protein